MKISEKQILDLLQKVIDPVTKLNIISLGMVSHVLIDQENNVKFSLEIEKESLEKRKSLLLNCKELLESVNGTNKVTIVFTNKSNIAKKTIVVGSGKGGVGKSTIALNIAVGLAEKGYKVAIVDADIYGPSIPHMLGITGKPEIKGGKIIPFEKYGVQSISIGYFLPTDSAVVWRGPMLTKSLQQMILGTSWNNLDYMIIDTPPGTGDVHISLAKICTISSAIVISTPQELSLIDATRAIDMFEKLKIPILGVVENMSYLVDSKGIKNYLFGKAGGKRLAENFSLKLLGEVPLNHAISSNCDAGFPSILNKEIGIYFLQILNAIS